jgi:hypothetical protein
MNLRRVIPTDVTASAIAHLLLLTLMFLFYEVHPFGAVPAETVAVEIVTPQEAVEKQELAENKPEPEPTPTPQPDFSLPDKAAATSAPAAQPAPAQPPKQAASPPPPAATPQQSTPPQKQAAPPPPASPPASQQLAAAKPQAEPASPQPAYAPPEPDLSVKYHVLLGLPPELPPAPPPSQARAKADDNFDGAATKAADVASSVVTEFRRHFMTCAKLPASLKASDDVRVKLRVLMTPEGKLAADPALIEASASAKGPLLMQGAISALRACQPYSMLPADRYGEWKVLDLNFTPQDFSS